MRGAIGLLGIAGFVGVVAVAYAQAQGPSPFDGTYRAVATANVNATYTDRNGRTGPCPNRRPGPLHIQNGRVRYTTATGYKIRGTVDPQGMLQLNLVAPPNSSNAGSSPLNLSVSGSIDSTGAARVRQTSNSCSYDFTWQRAQ
jgi:hypothetical protein